MEPPKKWTLILADGMTRIDAPEALLKYFLSFNESYNDFGVIEFHEDPLFVLDEELWRTLILAIYQEHEDLYEHENPTTIAIESHEKALLIKALSLDDLYELIRALNFYDIPLLLIFVIKELVRRLLPMNLDQLYLSHRKFKRPSEEELMKNFTDPLEWIVRSYAIEREVLRRIFEHYLVVHDLVQLVEERFLPPIKSVIACGDNFSLILTSRGLYATGQNHKGQLGLGHNASTQNPVRVPLDRVISVACGAYFSLVLTTSGLYASGSNSEGQLGLGDTENRMNFKKVDIDLVLSMACGDDHSIILCVDGVYTCGGNDSGQLGLGVLFPAWRSHPTRIDMPGGAEVIAVAASYQGSHMLTRDGSVYTCGANSWGELGLGDNQFSIPVPTKVQLSQPVRSIATGNEHMLMLMKNNNTVYACGSNVRGALGQQDQKKEDHLLPVLIESIQEADAIFTTHFTTMIQSRMPKGFYACGYNTMGQLGLGDKNEHLIPTPVATFATSEVIEAKGGEAHTLLLTLGGLYACGYVVTGATGLSEYTTENVVVPRRVRTLEMGHENVEFTAVKRQKCKETVTSCSICGEPREADALFKHVKYRYLFCGAKCFDRFTEYTYHYKIF